MKSTREVACELPTEFTQSESLGKHALAVEDCSLLMFRTGTRSRVRGAGAEVFLYRACFLQRFRSRLFCALPSAIVCHCML